MRLEFLDLAKADLIEGYRFYEARETGLGSYFLASIEADIESLRIYGGLHRVIYRGFRRALCLRFPFAIYYTVAGDAVQIRAVVDCRRDPAWIRRHLLSG